MTPTKTQSAAGFTWRRRAVGGWITTDGVWSIRGPIWGKRLYWLYRAGNLGVERGGERYTPTGKYNDCVNFKSVASAKKYVAAITAATQP